VEKYVRRSCLMVTEFKCQTSKWIYIALFHTKHLSCTRCTSISRTTLSSMCADSVQVTNSSKSSQTPCPSQLHTDRLLASYHLFNAHHLRDVIRAGFKLTVVDAIIDASQQIRVHVTATVNAWQPEHSMYQTPTLWYDNVQHAEVIASVYHMWSKNIKI